MCLSQIVRVNMFAKKKSIQEVDFFIKFFNTKFTYCIRFTAHDLLILHHCKFDLDIGIPSRKFLENLYYL